jgi:hypothetical protein
VTARLQKEMDSVEATLEESLQRPVLALGEPRTTLPEKSSDGECIITQASLQYALLMELKVHHVCIAI